MTCPRCEQPIRAGQHSSAPDGEHHVHAKCLAKPAAEIEQLTKGAGETP
jgi:hypothetical protein